MKLIEYPERQRIWVIRAQGGIFVANFKKDSLVAIGHIDHLKLDFTRGEPFFPNLFEIRDELRKDELKKNPPSANFRTGNYFAQIKSFIAEIQIGDLVVTIDKRHLMVGRVVGYPYIDQAPVTYHDSRLKKPTVMNYILRRKIQWGPKMDKRSLPLIVQKTLSARQTVFNIDKYWEYIYHLLYPVFTHKGILYFSTNLKHQYSIDSYYVGQLFQILSEIEVVTKSANKIIQNDNIDFRFLLDDLIINNNLSLTSKAEFLSPGSIWSKIGFSDKTGRKIIIASLLYGAIFGVDLQFIQFDGVVNKEIREKVVDYFFKRLESNNYEKIKEKLNIQIPQEYTIPLEDSTNDSPPDERALAYLENMDEYYLF